MKVSILLKYIKSRWVILSIVIMITIVLMSPLFSYAYEPLDYVVEQFNAVEKQIYEAPMPDYIIPVLGETAVSGILSGIIGVFITLFVCLVLGYVLRIRRTEKTS